MIITLLCTANSHKNVRIFLAVKFNHSAHPFFIPVELLSYCQLMGLLAEASEKAFPYPLALNPMQNAVIRNYMQVHWFKQS